MQAYLKTMSGSRAAWRGIALALVLGTVLPAPLALAANGSVSDATRLSGLTLQADAVQQRLDGFSGFLDRFVPPASVGPSAVAPVLVAQSSRDTASLAVRLDRLEEQMRLINGQVEGLQFQLTQLQTLLERMQEDTDARFTALEGGVAPGKTSAASRAGGATPAGEASQSLDLTMPGQQTQTDTGAGSGGFDPTDAPIELGAPEHPLGTLAIGDLAAAGGGEIDLGQGGGPLVTDADADAQYKAGYDAVIRGDYEFAEEQFRQFIGLFPDHPMAPDATNWLGEALIQRGDYEEAANILLNGFQTYPNSTRAPDILMKLGIALSGTGETETACRTFSEVLRRYPTVSPTFKQRLSEEVAKAGC